MKLFIKTFTFLAAAFALATAQGQNLLVNGDLEATPADIYFDGSDPTLADDVPGWLMSIGAPNGSYVYVNGVGTGNVDLDMQALPTGATFATASGSRPAVVAGLGYLASLTTDNYFAATQTSYMIDWFNSGGSLLSSSGGGPLGDPNGPLTYDPYNQLFQVLAVAPAGAVSAGVRLTSGDAGYGGLAADNFSLSQVPEPASAAMVGLAALGLVGTSRRRREGR